MDSCVQHRRLIRIEESWYFERDCEFVFKWCVFSPKGDIAVHLMLVIGLFSFIWNHACVSFYPEGDTLGIGVEGDF